MMRGGVAVLQGMACFTSLAADAHDARPLGCPVLQAWQLIMRGLCVSSFYRPGR